MRETITIFLRSCLAYASKLWTRLSENRLWITTLVLVGVFFLADSLYYFLVDLSEPLGPSVKRSVYGSFLLLLIGPIMVWAILRGVRTDRIGLNDHAGSPAEPMDASPHRKVRAAMLATVGLICTLVGLSHFSDVNVAAQVKHESEAINQAAQLSIQATRLAWLTSLPLENSELRTLARGKINDTVEQIQLLHAQLNHSVRTLNDNVTEHPESLLVWLRNSDDCRQRLASSAAELLSQTTVSAPNTEVNDTRIGELCTDYRAQMDALVEVLRRNRDRNLSEAKEGKYAAIISMAVMLFVLLFAVVEPTTRLVRLQHEKVISQNAKLARLATVAERTTNSVIIADLSGEIVWVNDGFTRLTGFSLDDVTGKSIDEIHKYEKTSQQSVAWMREAIKAGQPFRCELLDRGKDGREYWLDIDLQPQHDSQGKRIGFVAIENDITAQVLEREWLRSTFAAVAEGIVQLNLAGEIISCNPAAERILGMTSQELMHLQAQDSSWGITREDGTPLPDEEHPVLTTLRTGKSVRNSIQGITTRSGERRMISVSTEPIWDAEGDIVAAVASFADLTEQHEQAKRMELVISGAALGTCDWDVPTGHVIYNEHWAGQLGYTVDEISSHVSTWEKLVHPDDKEYVLPLLQKHLDGHSHEYQCEVRMRRKDGTYAWILTTGKVLHRDEDGKPLRVLGMHLDISSRKHAELEMIEAKANSEKALREVNALRSALDEHSLLSVTDRAGTITDVNTGFSRISGYSREELIGQNHRILNSGVHPKSFWNDVWSKIGAGKTWRGEVCNRRKDGSLYWVDSTIVPYRNAEGQIEKFVSIRFDVTAQKQAEEALVAAQAQAEAANAAKTEFLANMSHEIRTPMTAILGFTDLLATDGHRERAPQRRLEYIETIRRNGEHLLEIINDILDISKIEAGKMNVERVPTAPANLVLEVLSLMDVRAKAKGLLFEAIFENPVPATIQTDPVRVRQILVNLVGNALKFTEMGSVVLKIRTDAENEQIHFSVADTGIGMTPSQVGKLFGAFVQADASTTRKFGGTGLGLRISKRLAEMLGGDISVTSEPDRGSVFTASIACGNLAGVEMLSPGQAAAPVREEIPRIGTRGLNNRTERQRLEGMRILLAEDGPDNQRLIGHFLRKAGAEVTVVENGKLAVESLTVDNTLDGDLLETLPFDLLVTDMQMPEMDGYAAARLLRSRGCTLPIVALTANAMSSDMERCLQAGCDGYATKPIERNTLIETCYRWGRLHKASNEADTVASESSQHLPQEAVMNLFHDLFASPSLVENS
jgi:PAS domain S-box-containing protein